MNIEIIPLTTSDQKDIILKNQLQKEGKEILQCMETEQDTT